jgi:hypothetical protein
MRILCRLTCGNRKRSVGSPWEFQPENGSSQEQLAAASEAVRTIRTRTEAMQWFAAILDAKVVTYFFVFPVVLQFRLLARQEILRVGLAGQQLPTRPRSSPRC